MMRGRCSAAHGALAMLLTVAVCADDSEAADGHARLPFTTLSEAGQRPSGLAYAVPARSDGATPTSKKRRRRRQRGSGASSDTASTCAAPSTEYESRASAQAYAAPPPLAQSQRRFLSLPRTALVPGTAAPGPVPEDMRHLPQLFVGQLKKNAAAESLRAILSLLAPHVTPVHIEPLYNRTTGQGRGCAWLYLRNARDATAVLELHHRVFLDTDAATDSVGLWVCDCRGEAELRAFADARVTDDYVQRKKKLLPRQPLVVEHAARTQPPQMSHPPAGAGAPWPAWPAAAVQAPAPLSDCTGPFPRAIPSEGIVLVAPRRYRNDPYIGLAGAALPAYSDAVLACA